MPSMDITLCITMDCPVRGGCVRAWMFNSIAADELCTMARFTIPEGADRCDSFIPVLFGVFENK